MALSRVRGDLSKEVKKGIIHLTFRVGMLVVGCIQGSPTSAVRGKTKAAASCRVWAQGLGKMKTTGLLGFIQELR